MAAVYKMNSKILRELMGHNIKENRLQEALKLSEKQRLKRVTDKKTSRSRTDLPFEKRKLTQKEAAAYCGVSTATINRWKDQGLKSVKWGKMQRYMISDLKSFIIKKRQKK